MPGLRQKLYSNAELSEYKKNSLKNRCEITVKGCWLINTGKYRKYGIASFKNNVWYAHRLSFLLYNGEIPKEYEIDHLCHNTNCINPEHLEAVTKIENLRRQCFARTHCKNGHEFSEDNKFLVKRKGRKNNFECRTCKENRKRVAYYKFTKPARQLASSNRLCKECGVNKIPKLSRKYCSECKRIVTKRNNKNRYLKTGVIIKGL